MESESELEHNQVVQGRWSHLQHRRFLQGIVLYGKDWKKIDELVKTRTGPQVRSHAQKFFMKLKKLCREHRKCRTRQIVKLSDLQSQISALFTEKDITEHTPLEFAAVIRKDWSILIPRKKRYRKNRAAKIQMEKFLFGQDNEKQIISQENYQKLNTQSDKVFLGEFEEKLEEQEKQSYFIQLLKYEKKNWLEDDQLLKFQKFSQEPIPSNTSSKKYSFTLPDKEQNSAKLKQRLENFHKAIQHSSKAFNHNLTF